MSRIPFKDMVRKERVEKKTIIETALEQKEIQKKIFSEEPPDYFQKTKPKNLLWLIALISAVFCFFAISFLFSKAVVTINPKMEEIALNENLPAGRDSVGNGLAYNLVIIPGEESRTIQATGEKDVFKKATGLVVIYNTFSSSPQVLSVDTRLEGSNGKIYKTQTRTVVPGISTKGLPGSVEAKIYADEPGSEYNSGPLDFNIVGFKGTPKYEKFYARSKGNISGGLKGKVPAISEEDEMSLLKELNSSLKTKLLKKAIDQTPAGFVLFDGATFFDESGTNVSYSQKDGNNILVLTGTLYGLLFDEQKLTEKIVKDKIENYNNSDIFISNIKNLTFLLANKDNDSINNAKNINFNLSGKAKVVWKLDADEFILDLLGKRKKDFSQMLAQYKNIDSATLKLSPLWRRSLPEDPENIEIMVNYSQ